MQTFDRAFADTVKNRFETVAEDAQPQWGEMTRGQVQGHLQLVVDYTLGENPELPYRGNFKTRHIFRRVILWGLKEIPHNIKVPRPEGVSKERFFPAVPLESLVESMDRYVEAIAAGGLPSRTHPFFGVLTPEEWQRFHRLHFIHHMKQFGIGEGL